MARTPHPWSRQAKELGLKTAKKWSGTFNLPDFHAWCLRLGQVDIGVSHRQDVIHAALTGEWTGRGPVARTLIARIRLYEGNFGIVDSLREKAQNFVGHSAIVERVDISQFTDDAPFECRMVLVLTDPDPDFTN